MINKNIKYWFLLTILMISMAAGFAQTTIDQKLSVLTNSRVNGGEFVVEYMMKGTNLTSSNTLGSLNADLIYDSTAIRFVSESNWNASVCPESGYERYVGNNSESNISRSVRIMVQGINVNNDTAISLYGYNVNSSYQTIVRLNFIILDNTKSTSVTVKSLTNQVGLFQNPGNNPSTFEIEDKILTAPQIIDNEPLPVTLASFNSNVKVNTVTLNWITASEQNNAGFSIERKSNSESGWTSVGFVKGNGTTNSQSKYSYEDTKLSAGKYNYRLKQTDNNGNYKYYNLNNQVEISTPSKYNLSQNYPNPFNPATKINYELPKDSKVNITVYDVVGREVLSLVNQEQKAGFYTISVDSKNLASGTYFYRMIAKSDNNNENVLTKKMSVIK